MKCYQHGRYIQGIAAETGKHQAICPNCKKKIVGLYVFIDVVFNEGTHKHFTMKILDQTKDKRHSKTVGLE